jgi:hypothetical protein
MSKQVTLAALYFLLSTVITWWFIVASKTLYFSTEKMIFSCGIAGAKWGIQIIAALVFLQEKKWEFIKLIGFTCFIGSCVLLPYCLFSFVRTAPNSFLISLVLAVLLMIATYYKIVKQLALSTKWFWGWMLCLATAITLQLTVIFKIIGL